MQCQKLCLGYRLKLRFGVNRKTPERGKIMFWYMLKFRAPGPGCQPKDFAEIDYCKGRWGAVGYIRELTVREIEEYELVPC